MEPTVRIEVVHRVIDVQSGQGNMDPSGPPASGTGATPSPFVDLHAVRLDLLETVVNDLATRWEQILEKLDNHWNAIKQLESKVMDLNRRVSQHDTLLRTLVVTPKTRARAQRAGLGFG